MSDQQSDTLNLKARLKEEAQRRRASQAKRPELTEEKPTVGLFDKPKKVQNSNTDQTYNEIVRVLGKFDTIQPFVGTLNQTQQYSVGVIQQPPTPQVTTNKTFNYKAPINGVVKNVPSKTIASEKPNHDKKHSGVKFKAEPDQDASETKSKPTDIESLPGQKQKGSNESKAGRDSKVSIISGDKGKGESKRDECTMSVSPVKSSSNSHVVSKDLHKRDSPFPSPGPKSRPPAKPPSTPPLKDLTPSITSQVESQIHKASSRPQSSTPLKETPPPNGVVKRLGKDETKNRLPKLTIPQQHKELAQGGKDLDDIFREMIHIQPPLTGINTPLTKLEETFPFPVKPQNKDVKVISETKVEGNQEECQKTLPIIRKDSLSRDLVISSDESEPEQPPPECQTGKKSPMNAVGKRRISMSSNSDGSSNGSDSSSASDSDLSSSEDEEDKDDKPSPSASLTLPKSPAKESQNWGLRTFIDAVKQSSPEAPISLDAKPCIKNLAPKKIDKTNENLLEELISPRVSLKDIGPTVSLPFNTDHLDGKEHIDNIFAVQFAKDTERHQNGVESMDESFGHNTDHAISSVESLGSPGSLSSCSNASSRYTGKPAKSGHRRLSSAAEKVNKSSNNSEGVKHCLNVSKSGANQSKERTTPKHSKVRTITSSAEKKEKSNFKSKTWISDSDSESDFVDVETVTPDGKSTGLLSNHPFIDDKKKASVFKQLFTSPKDDDSSSSSHGSISITPSLDEKEKVNVHEKVCKDNKQKGHRKRERDKELKNVCLDDVTVEKLNCETSADSDKHVDDIIESLQTTKEFKPPGLLSPIPPFSSPNHKTCDQLSLSQLPGITYRDGMPSIIVQIRLLLLDCIPSKDYSQSASGVVPLSSDVSAHSKVLTDAELVTDAKSLPSSHTKEPLSPNKKSNDIIHSHKSLAKQTDEDICVAEKVKSHSDVSDVVLSKKVNVKSSDSPEKLKSKMKISETDSSIKVKPCSKLINSDSVEKGKIKSELTHDSLEKSRSKLKVRDSERKLLEDENTQTKVRDSKSPEKLECVTKLDDTVKLNTKLSSSESPEKVKLTTKVIENEFPSDVKSNSRVFSNDVINKTKHKSKSSLESNLLDKKSQKRKTDLDRTENIKRYKSSSKSNKQPEETDRIENGISVDEEDDKPNFLSKRRGSTSSTSSHHSNKSHTKKTKFEVKVKRESPSPLRSTQEKETAVPHAQQNGDSHLPFNSYSEDHNHIQPKREPAPNDALRSLPSTRCPLENNLKSADTYLAKAKVLKHQADKEKPVKICTYIEAVLQFIQCGCAMERDQLSEPNKIFTMYHETLQLLKYICRVRSSHEFDLPVKDKKLSVLILRIQGLLYLKLFNLKRGEAIKFKKIIDHDHNKSATPKAPAHAPSPHQSSWNNRSTGTPSPMSPTPSPAGSIGSVGSQGSCDLTSSKLTNGSSGSNAMTSPGMVMVSQRIHSVTQQYINITNYVVQSYDLWAQADLLAHESQDFFTELNQVCGPLSLHNSVLELVEYVQQGLQRLKDT